MRPGARVNIEVDVLARYVARQLEFQGRDAVHNRGADERETDDDDADRDQRLLEKLRTGGWV
jgi:riboflavin synthase